MTPKSVLKQPDHIVTCAFTSWLGIGMNKVDFPARYIEPFVPSNIDGCVFISVGVLLHTRAEMMQGSLKNPLLQKYRDVGGLSTVAHKSKLVSLNRLELGSEGK